mmetsp:Transcript_15659/g.39474  ORF Transcript_15659/g.39474 Transcript_15659/m.39474 type:complete len:247 (-) Transcript_15659:714-1454(-)
MYTGNLIDIDEPGTMVQSQALPTTSCGKYSHRDLAPVRLARLPALQPQIGVVHVGVLRVQVGTGQWSLSRIVCGSARDSRRGARHARLAWISEPDMHAWLGSWSQTCTFGLDLGARSRRPSCVHCAVWRIGWTTAGRQIHGVPLEESQVRVSSRRASCEYRAEDQPQNRPNRRRDRLAVAFFALAPVFFAAARRRAASESSESTSESSSSESVSVPSEFDTSDSSSPALSSPPFARSVRFALCEGA